ncbi:MAG TPA: c-type cytochrome [Gemmatimonadaceae bacterium]
MKRAENVVRTTRRVGAGVLQAAALTLLVPAWLAGSRIQEPAPTPAEIALGESVFNGRAGGALCYVCHGPKAKGVAGIGPDLTDKEWLHGDGSRTFIEKIVTDGVAKPKKVAAPMPPKGGGQLTDPQIKAVAAYVFTLSHPTR